MRRFISVIAVLTLLCLSLTACGGHKTASVRREAYESEELQFTAPQEGDPIAIFDTSLGEVRAVLFPDQAPMAVDNFTGLAQQGYYDGLPFHRIVYGFVAQAGDDSETGLSGATIWHNNPYPVEFSDELHHYSGALGMAHSGDEKDTCLSQFYFVQALPDMDRDLKSALESSGFRQEVIDAYEAVGGLPYLDNQYTVFGQVYQGMSVVDAIGAVETDEEGRPLEAPVIRSVSISTYSAQEENAAAEADSDPAES